MVRNLELAGQSGPKPNCLTTASRPQQADFPDGDLDVRDEGQSWMNRKQNGEKDAVNL